MIRSGFKSALDVFRQWDWALYLLIFLYMALPQFYRSYSIYLIGNAIPDTNALATVAQYQFIDLLLEVVQETFVLAIFFFVGKGLQSRVGPGSPIRTSLTLILGVSVVLAAVLFSFSSTFVSIIGTPPAIQDTHAAFFKLKTPAVPVFLLCAASVVIVETVNRKKLIFTLAVMQVIYRFILDSLFYGGYSFSLNAGVLGVAWADVLSSLALLITALILIRRPLTDKLWRGIYRLPDRILDTDFYIHNGPFRHRDCGRFNTNNLLCPDSDVAAAEESKWNDGQRLILSRNGIIESTRANYIQDGCRNG